MVKFLFILFCALFSLNGIAQDKNKIKFNLDKSSVDYSTFSDSINYNQFKSQALIYFKMKGYTGIQIVDSITKNNTTTYVLKADKRIKKVVLKNDQNNIYTDFNHTFESINKEIIELENNGFPFAQIKINNDSLSDKTLYINYQIDSGNYYKFDKIHLKSETPYNAKTILNIIHIKPNEPYNEQKLRKVKKLIKASKNYKLLREPEVVFYQNKAEIYIYFEKIKSSSADGYVGLLQDQNTQKLILNGYINLKLQNSLNRAELLNLNWRSSPDKTQNLIMNLAYPYLFNTPFGITTDLNLQKQDTTFIRSLANFGLNYKQDVYEIGIFNQIESSTLLNKQSDINFVSYSKNTIGSNLIFRPYLENKLSFYTPTITAMFGFFNFKTDSIKLATNSGNMKYRVGLNQKFDFLNYFSFTNDFSYQGIQSSYSLSRNELIYFGGLKSVRGFYELELIGNNVTTILNEIEFTPLPILSFKAIYDYSNFKFGNNTRYTNSLGVGFGLVNENSKLEIIIANGKINDDAFNLSNTKVHIGFTSSF